MQCPVGALLSYLALRGPGAGASVSVQGWPCPDKDWLGDDTKESLRGGRTEARNVCRPQLQDWS